jgi:small subunit ribosomal protein S1
MKVLNVEPDKRRLGLSIKALIDNPHESKKPKEAASPEPSNYKLPDEERGFSLGDIIGNNKLNK